MVGEEEAEGVAVVLKVLEGIRTSMHETRRTKPVRGIITASVGMIRRWREEGRCLLGDWFCLPRSLSRVQMLDPHSFVQSWHNY
jgi:hypothetical protein